MSQFNLDEMTTSETCLDMSAKTNRRPQNGLMMSDNQSSDSPINLENNFKCKKSGILHQTPKTKTTSSGRKIPEKGIKTRQVGAEIHKIKYNGTYREIQMAFKQKTKDFFVDRHVRRDIEHSLSKKDPKTDKKRSRFPQVIFGMTCKLQRKRGFDLSKYLSNAKAECEHYNWAQLFALREKRMCPFPLHLYDSLIFEKTLVDKKKLKDGLTAMYTRLTTLNRMEEKHTGLYSISETIKIMKNERFDYHRGTHYGFKYGIYKSPCAISKFFLPLKIFSDINSVLRSLFTCRYFRDMIFLNYSGFDSQNIFSYLMIMMQISEKVYKDGFKSLKKDSCQVYIKQSMILYKELFRIISDLKFTDPVDKHHHKCSLFSIFTIIMRTALKNNIHHERSIYLNIMIVKECPHCGSLFDIKYPVFWWMVLRFRLYASESLQDQVSRYNNPTGSNLNPKTQLCCKPSIKKLPMRFIFISLPRILFLRATDNSDKYKVKDCCPIKVPKTLMLNGYIFN